MAARDNRRKSRPRGRPPHPDVLTPTEWAVLLKVRMAYSHPCFVPGPADPLSERVFPLFFDVLATLLESGVTVVAEAAFQGSVWRPRLERLATLADLRVVQCLDPGSAARTVSRAPGWV